MHLLSSERDEASLDLMEALREKIRTLTLTLTLTLIVLMQILLEKTNVFRELPSGLIRELAKQMTYSEKEAGERIYSQGAHPIPDSNPNPDYMDSLR